MRKILPTLITLIFLGFHQSSFAQADINLLTKWEHQRKDSPYDKINEVISTTHGYIVAVGQTLSQNRQNLDGLFLIIKADDGKEVLRKTYGGTGDQSFNAAVQNHNGTFTLVGYSSASRKADKDGWVLQVDWYGKELFKAKPASNNGADDELTKVAIDAQGRVLAAGTQTLRKSQQLWLVNLQSEKFQERLINNPSLQQFSDMTAAPDQGFVLIGSTSADNRQQPEDAWLLKVGPDGQDLWGGPRFYGDADFQQGHGITATRDGGYALVGTDNSKGAGLSDHWLVKLDQSGKQVWERHYGRAYGDVAQSVTELSLGGYAILGQTFSYMPRAKTSMLEMVITNARGAEIDRKTYPIYYGEGNEIATNVIEIYNGDLVLAGNDISPSNGAAKLYLAAQTYKPFQRNPNAAKSGADDLLGAAPGAVENAAQALEFSGVRFFDANGNNYLEAGERGYISLRISNKSNTYFRNVSTTVEADNQNDELDFWKDIKLGTIQAGQTEELRIPVHAKKALSAENYQLAINLDVDGSFSGRTTATVKTNTTPDPALLMVDQNSFLPANNPQPGVPVVLKVTLVNSGGLSSKPMTIDFKIPAGVRSTESERKSVPSLTPRSKHTMTYTFIYDEGFVGTSIPISVEANGHPLKQTFFLPVSPATVMTKQPNPILNPASNGASDEMIWASHDPNKYRTRAVDVNNNSVDVKVITLSKGPLEKRNFKMMVNGKVSKGQKNLGEVSLSPPSGSTGRNRQDYNSKVQLSPGMNQVQILYTYPDGREIKSDPINFNYIPKDQPNLYVLSIGVAHEDLKYTTKDANDIYRAFDQLRADNGFKKVRVYPLTEKETTTQRNIKRAFVDLTRSGINENDLVVVFISTHGKVSQRGRYILLPSDFESQYEEETSIDFKNDILNKLDMINANVLVLIDACQSGSAYSGSRSMFNDETSSVFMNKLINNTSGMEIIASCGEREFSYEDDSWGNGAFTKSILEAFRNEKVEVKNGKRIQADIYNELEVGVRNYGPDGIITIEELRNFITQRVPHLVQNVKGKPQHPSHKSTERLSKSLGIYMVNK